jgi:hypothetical protein
MRALSYDALRPLIHREEPAAGTMTVVFRCPESGVEATASAPIRAGQGLRSAAARSVKRNLWHSLRTAVLGAIHSVLGHGIGGRVASEVTGQAMADAQRGQEHTADDRRAAVVAAFERVQSSFRWDARRTRWVGAAPADTPFGRQLAAAPVAARYDQGVLARLLTEIVCADGAVQAAEREFLEQFVDPGLGALETLAKRPPLTDTELAAVEAGVGDTLVLLAWAAALSDEDLADAEAARLQAVARALGITDTRCLELRGAAQQFLFEEALRAAYGGEAPGRDAVAEAMVVGAKLGLSDAEAERLDVAYRKRHGIV